MSDSLSFTPHFRHAGADDLVLQHVPLSELQISRYSAAAQGQISSAVKRISEWLNNWCSVAAEPQTSTITVPPLVIAHKDGLRWVRQEPVTGAGWRP
jgi:hypothetical protein